MKPIEEDPLISRLSRLPSLAPDPDRRAHVRARCHALLDRQRHGRHRPARAIGFFERAFVGAVAALYVTAVVRSALAMYGL